MAKVADLWLPWNSPRFGIGVLYGNDVLCSNICMTNASSARPTGWRILGFGKHPEIAAAVQEKLRSLGFQATNFVLTNDEAGDARLVAELKRADYDGIAIGGYINGQDAVNFPATVETTVWFNRILNMIHANAPTSKIILVRGPEDVVPAIGRVLGKHPPS